MSKSTPRPIPQDPFELGLFPLPNMVLFPGQLSSLHVFEPRYRKLVSDALEQGSKLGLPRLKPGFDAEYYGAPPVFETCGVGHITEYARLPDGRFNIVVLGVSRVRLLEELRQKPYRVARVQALADEAPATPVVAQTFRTKLIELMRRAAPALPAAAQSLESRIRSTRDPGECADILAGSLIEDPDERQALLEELEPCRRISGVIAHLHQLASRLPGAATSPLERLN